MGRLWSSTNARRLADVDCQLGFLPSDPTSEICEAAFAVGRAALLSQVDVSRRPVHGCTGRRVDESCLQQAWTRGFAGNIGCWRVQAEGFDGGGEDDVCCVSCSACC
jgi:hypothetical protein